MIIILEHVNMNTETEETYVAIHKILYPYAKDVPIMPLRIIHIYVA